MLVLKLLLVPTFLLLVSLAGRRFGPAVAGWLAGLPVVTGPILFVLALENGPRFAATAAAASESAVLASLGFGAAYANACRRLTWAGSLALGLLAWLAAIVVLSRLPAGPMVGLTVALATLVVTPRLFPVGRPTGRPRPLSTFDLALRMVAGALLTLAVTLVARILGGAWSGLLAVFPLMAIVLSVSSHLGDGAEFTVSLLRGMATGMYAFTAFCLTLALTLTAMSIPFSFCCALLACLVVQGVTRTVLVAHAAAATR